MTQQERMQRGMLYDPADAAILQEQAACARRMNEYNALGAGDR